MQDRLVIVSTLVTGLALLGLQVAFKPPPDPDEVRSIAQMGTAPADWSGRVAPDFDTPLLDGSTFRLADHVGRDVVILNFFTTWCGPCRQEMPELQRYADSFHGKPLIVLGIDVEERRNLVEGLVKELRVGFPVAVDESGAVGRAFGVTAYPTTVVVGADGRVAHYESGAISNADVALGRLVGPQLEAIAAGRGISREAYLDAWSKEKDKPAASTGQAEKPLTGQARRIAEAMTCPCGCVDKVVACTCNTSKQIKQRLAAGGYEAKSDDEVIRELNREFCGKGM
jgi:thiol-disulfide isomerase/thioredoxin